MKTQSAESAELVEAVDRLDQETRAFASRLSRSASDLWIWRSPNADPLDKADLTPSSLRRRAVDQLSHIIRAIEFADGQDPGTTEICPGLVAVPPAIISEATALNEAKRRVAQAWTALEGARIEVVEPISGTLKKVSLRSHTLAGCGRARHHHRQAIREIVAFDHPLEYVGFTWARVRSITRTTCAAVHDELEMLRADGSGLIDADLEALSLLPPDEPLARIRKLNVQPRANVSWRDEKGVQKRAVVRASLPILVVGAEVPRFRPLPPEPLPAHYRMERSDFKIESEPYLKSRSVYRYLDPQAARARSTSRDGSKPSG